MAETAAHILKLEPETELRFRGPIGEEEVRAELKLTNISETNVCFKIKTTCPTSYTVRPVMGKITPKDSITCTISLQPFYKRKTSHKFMVVFTMAKEDTAVDAEVKWDQISPDQIMKVKLKSIFEVSGSNDKNQDDSSHIEDVINGETREGACLNEQEKCGNCERLQVKIYSLKEENRQLQQELLKLRQEKAGGSEKKQTKRKIVLSDFKAGDKVEAFYQPDQTWYKGTVLKKIGSGYKIKYFDGYSETLNSKFIRR